MKGDPGLLQDLPDIAALLPQGGGDREQPPAAADGTAWRLDAKADFALDERLAHCSLGGIVGGFDSGMIQKGLQGFFSCSNLWQVRTAWAHGVPSFRAKPRSTAR